VGVKQNFLLASLAEFVPSTFKTVAPPLSYHVPHDHQVSIKKVNCSITNADHTDTDYEKATNVNCYYCRISLLSLRSNMNSATESQYQIAARSCMRKLCFTSVTIYSDNLNAKTVLTITWWQM